MNDNNNINNNIDEEVEPYINCDGYYPQCPRCFYYDLTEYKDCPNCGQKINWDWIKKY